MPTTPTVALQHVGVGAVLALGIRALCLALSVVPSRGSAAVTYCAECREPGHFPWQHATECIEGLKHRCRIYEFVLRWVLLLLMAETVLLLVAFYLIGRVM